jgi:hypothetical protein
MFHKTRWINISKKNQGDIAVFPVKIQKKMNNSFKFLNIIFLSLPLSLVVIQIFRKNL